MKKNKKIKKNKFYAKEIIIDSIKFASQNEGNWYIKLKWLKKTGIITNFELQPKFSYQITYSNCVSECYKPAFYKADFKVFYLDGHIEIWDVKGYKTSTYLRKKKIIEILYGIKIIEKS